MMIARHSCCLALLLGLAAALAEPAHARDIEVVVEGVDEPIRTNVLSTVDVYQFTTVRRMTSSRTRRIRSEAAQRAAAALRPFGYYHPAVETELKPNADDWQLIVRIQPGEPVRVGIAEISVAGPGSELPALNGWLRRWKLKQGATLDQAVWETQKENALQLAEYEGYLSAEFTEHAIEIDLDRRIADLTLTLDTGPRAVMGRVDIQQDFIRADVLEKLPRFVEGEPYDAWLVERLRLDLWNSGYFSDIEVIEDRHLDAEPPRVDFRVNLQARNRNTYQGTIGYGTDTGPRAQLHWNRYLVSQRGDKIAVGAGWQEKNNEASVRGNYTLPRKTRRKDYWTADVLLKRENQDLKIKARDSDREPVAFANGSIRDYSLRLGRLRVRDLRRGWQQLFETIYVQVLREETDYQLFNATIDDTPALNSNTTYSLGINYDWPVIRGNGFATSGHHERGWLFTSHSAWGSDIDFTQAYLATSWNISAGRRWKFLLRGEIGYTDAKVTETVLRLPETTIEVSLTSLPNLYRFKAGGSQSVRGYGFETLSNNAIGSNHVITASAEVEYMFRRDWSAALFVDTGNAFNDWSNPRLKTGAGVGIRWYSIAGPIRLDFARALDLDGQPWRIHFTIGFPLL